MLGWLEAAHATREAWGDDESKTRHPELAARVGDVPALDALRERLAKSLDADGLNKLVAELAKAMSPGLNAAAEKAVAERMKAFTSQPPPGVIAKNGATTEREIDIAVRSGELPAGTDAAQLAFELRGVALAVNQAVQLRGDARAAARGRRAVRRLLG